MVSGGGICGGGRSVGRYGRGSAIWRGAIGRSGHPGGDLGWIVKYGIHDVFDGTSRCRAGVPSMGMARPHAKDWDPVFAGMMDGGDDGWVCTGNPLGKRGSPHAAPRPIAVRAGSPRHAATPRCHAASCRTAPHRDRIPRASHPPVASRQSSVVHCAIHGRWLSGRVISMGSGSHIQR